MADRESPMRMLDRSLAFTALLELSPEFRDMEVNAGSALITRLLEEYYEWLDEALARDLFRAGVHDIFTYARSWIAQGGMSKEA